MVTMRCARAGRGGGKFSRAGAGAPRAHRSRAERPTATGAWTDSRRRHTDRRTRVLAVAELTARDDHHRTRARKDDAMAKATPRVARYAYEARTTRVMCVRSAEWCAAMTEDTDAEARVACEVRALEDVLPGEWVRAYEDGAERWARVAAVAIGDCSEELVEYKARFFEDVDADEFLLGGFAAAANGTILASAPPPRFQRESRVEGFPSLIGKVEAYFYRGDKNQKSTQSIGWHAAACSSSDREMTERLQASVDEIDDGRFRVERRGKKIIIRDGDVSAVELLHSGHHTSHRVGELLFSANRVRITTREECERALVEKIVNELGAVRDVFFTAAQLADFETKGQLSLAANGSFRGHLGIATGPHQALNFGVPVREPAPLELVASFAVDNRSDEHLDEEFIADPLVWWAVGFWLGDGLVGGTAFAVGVDPLLDTDEDIKRLATAVNASRFNEAVYGATEFTAVMSVFATWIERGYADRISVSARPVIAGDPVNCVTVRACSRKFRTLLRRLALFDTKVISRAIALRLRSLPEACKLHLLAGLNDADGSRSLRDIDSVILSQAWSAIDDSLRTNSARGHDTILTLSCVLAASSHIDARMSLTRVHTHVPGDERHRWASMGHVAFSSSHRVIPNVVAHKRPFLSRPEALFSHVGASFGSWRNTKRRAVTAEITLEGASRMVLANGTVVAVKRAA